MQSKRVWRRVIGVDMVWSSRPSSSTTSAARSSCRAGCGEARCVAAVSVVAAVAAMSKGRGGGAGGCWMRSCRRSDAGTLTSLAPGPFTARSPGSEWISASAFDVGVCSHGETRAKARERGHRVRTVGPIRSHGHEPSGLPDRPGLLQVAGQTSARMRSEAHGATTGRERAQRLEPDPLTTPRRRPWRGSCSLCCSPWRSCSSGCRSRPTERRRRVAR